MPALLASLSPIVNRGLAFTNSKFNKTGAVARAKWHRQQDHYLQGTYGKDTPQGWKGCSVGCMVDGKHRDYPELFGVDVRIAYLSDAIFEGLPSPDYKDWTVKLFKSIKKGIDTKLVWYRFTYWMLANAEHGVVKFSKDPAITAVIELFHKAAGGVEVSRAEWKAAADRTCAACAAADAVYVYAAGYAAAAAAADVSYAARAAYAAHAAADAACAAHAAANAAARTKRYKLMANKLCYFLAGGV